MSVSSSRVADDELELDPGEREWNVDFAASSELVRDVSGDFVSVVPKIVSELVEMDMVRGKERKTRPECVADRFSYKSVRYARTANLLDHNDSRN